MTAQATLILEGTATTLRPPDPDEAAHTLTVEALIEAEHSARRAAFLAHMEFGPVDALVDLIRRICDRGRGCWTMPQTARHQRPATHLHEISLWGVLGTGETPEVAARNWRTAALRLRGHEA